MRANVLLEGFEVKAFSNLDNKFLKTTLIIENLLQKCDLFFRLFLIQGQLFFKKFSLFMCLSLDHIHSQIALLAFKHVW